MVWAIEAGVTMRRSVFVLASYGHDRPTARRRRRRDLVRSPGLSQPVEILRDRWGINHIYAQNEPDLFFAQGYAAAKDRLFQFEVWRRQATGTVAEILGRRELARDRGARLHSSAATWTRS